MQLITSPHYFHFDNYFHINNYKILMLKQVQVFSDSLFIADSLICLFKCWKFDLLFFLLFIYRFPSWFIDFLIIK